MRSFLQRSLLTLAIASPLSSCVLFLHEPTLTEPSKRDVAGTYTAEKISARSAGRKELKNASIRLLPDGRYQVSGVPGDFSSPLLPVPSSGTWRLTTVYGLDLGSRGNWGVMFMPKGGRSMSSHLQGEPKPWGLLLTDYTVHKQAGDYLLLRKTGP